MRMTSIGGSFFNCGGRGEQVHSRRLNTLCSAAAMGAIKGILTIRLSPAQPQEFPHSALVPLPAGECTDFSGCLRPRRNTDSLDATLQVALRDYHLGRLRSRGRRDLLPGTSVTAYGLTPASWPEDHQVHELDKSMRTQSGN